MLNFALSSTVKGGKNAPFISPASEAPILIRDDSIILGNIKYVH